METCSNCETTIGKLETPYVWKEHTVCESCYRRLSGKAAGQADASSDTDSDVAAGIAEELKSVELVQAGGSAFYGTPGQKHVGAGQVICSNPNCGAVVTPVQKRKGSALVMIFLFCIGVIPGLIYAIFASGYDYFCPRCGIKLRSEMR
jgi:hypothetical protein